MEYEDKIGKMLWDLPIKGEFVIEDNVSPERQDKFIEIVKTYIDRRLGWQDGFEILFSNDYKKVTKKSYPPISVV